MRILASKSNRQLGAKFMDYELLKFYADKFDSEHNLDIKLMESKKAVLKMIENIEKQRKVLTGIHEHDLNIECLLEDKDIFYTMKREEFETICSPIIERFKAMMR